MSTGWRKDAWPYVLFILAALIRLAYLAEMRSSPFFQVPQLDAAVYDHWALSIARGDWRGGSGVFFISPLYAYFLALIYRLFGHHYDIVRCVQIVLGSCTCALIYLIARDVFDKGTALFASFLGIFYGYSIFLDSELLKNSLAEFTLTASLYSVLQAGKKRSPLPWLLTGVFAGLTVVNQPNVLLLLPIFSLYAYASDRRSKPRGGLAHAGMLILGAAVVMAPVAIRNYVVGNDLVLVSSNGGINFFIGNNRDSDGGILTSRALSEMDPRKQENLSRAIAQRETDRRLKPSAISAYWFSRGMDFLREEPAAFLKLGVKKLFLFWNRYEVPDNLDYYYIKRLSAVLGLPLVTFGIIGPLGLTGLMLSAGEYRKHLLFYSAIAVFMFSVVLFMVFGRYRILIAPVLCVYAGHALQRILHFMRERDARKLLLSSVPAAALLLACNVNILSYPPEYSQKILGDIFMEKGRCEEAIAEYTDALKALPLNLSLRKNLASGLDKCGHTAEALNAYRRLLLFPLGREDKTAVRLEIAGMLADKGDRDGAKKIYRDVLGDDDGQAEALNNLAWLLYLDNEYPEMSRKYAEKALSLEPRSPEFMDTLAMILLKGNDYKRAYELLATASSLSPDSPEINAHLKDATVAAATRKR
ncbi:MAG: glycosyltransferase family 39 protein [Nitrospiraceae bacterium]|nr:glycosyltransferase family 39 protein [Nitrospiraceae bacterium]